MIEPEIPKLFPKILGRSPFLIVPLLKLSEYLLTKEPIILVELPSTMQLAASLCIAP